VDDVKILGFLFVFVVISWLIWLLVGMDMAWQQRFLLLVVLGWFFSFGWHGVTRRPLSVSLVPVVVFLPLLAVKIFRRGWRILRWFWFLRKRRLTHSEPVYVVPPTWDHLLADAQIVRRLLPARDVVLGYNQQRVVYAGLSEVKHLLITGVTGEGKTTIALSMLLSLLGQGPSVFGKMLFSIHDTKGVTALHFKPLADMFPGQFDIYSDVHCSYRALEALVEEMHQRTHRLGEERQFDIDALGLPHRLVLIDEPQLFYRKKSDYEERVLELVTAGRQAGFHIILLTPYGKGDVISTDYRPNFRFISGYLPKHAESVVEMPVSRLPEFHFLYQQTVRSFPVIFTTYKIEPRHVEQTINTFLAHHANVEAEEIALDIFVNTPNCGFRTLLREGALRCQALKDQGRLGEIPWPWSGVTVNGVLKYNREVRQWAFDFLDELARKGIASPAGPGQARKALVSLEQAKTIWKERGNGTTG
jgi:hypothetical protein